MFEITSYGVRDNVIRLYSYVIKACVRIVMWRTFFQLLNTSNCLLMVLVHKAWLTVFIITVSEKNSLLHGLFLSGNTFYWFLLVFPFSSVELETMECKFDVLLQYTLLSILGVNTFKCGSYYSGLFSDKSSVCVWLR